MGKAKKHRWVTDVINTGDRVLSVWPSKDDLSTKTKEAKFFEMIERIGDDPRVVNVRKVNHPEYMVVFLFDIDENNEHNQ